MTLRDLALLLALSFSLAACAPEQAPAAAPPPPPPVSVSQPIVRKLVEWDEYVGRLEAVEEVEVRARVSGYLEEVHFKDGGIVEEGDLLFVIDARPFQAALDRELADLQSNEARLSLAEQLVSRSERLLERNATSEEEVDIRRGEVAQATAAVAASQAAVTNAKLDLEFTRVVAPLSGRISENYVDEGNLINGGSALSTLLTTINALDPIHAVFDADEQSYLKYVRLDREEKRQSSRDVRTPVAIETEDEDGFPHRGNIDFVDNRLDRATGTIRARAVFDNPDGALVPGLFVRARLPGSPFTDTLLIPDVAIATSQTDVFVWVIDEQNNAEQRIVTIGGLAYGLRIVRSGLEATDRVVISGLQRVRPGAPVTPQAKAIELTEDPVSDSLNAMLADFLAANNESDG